MLQKKFFYNNFLDNNHFIWGLKWVTINMIHQIYNNIL